MVVNILIHYELESRVEDSVKVPFIASRWMGPNLMWFSFNLITYCRFPGNTATSNNRK